MLSCPLLQEEQQCDAPSDYFQKLSATLFIKKNKFLIENKITNECSKDDYIFQSLGEPKKPTAYKSPPVKTSPIAVTQHAIKSIKTKNEDLNLLENNHIKSSALHSFFGWNSQAVSLSSAGTETPRGIYTSPDFTAIAFKGLYISVTKWSLISNICLPNPTNEVEAL